MISSESLYNALMIAAESARENKNELNNINVFPVSDNDTGNNISHTMDYILKYSKKDKKVRESLKSIALASLNGSRGNSGAIFSQYFNGFYKKSKDTLEVSLSELSEYFHEAYDAAYKAVEKPFEGTVLTLMRAWALAFNKASKSLKSLSEILNNSLSSLKNTLNDTKKHLKVLKDNNVVDAGALGFYYFMKGFVESLISGKKIEKKATLEITHHHHDLTTNIEDIKFRYCTEALVKNKDGFDLGKIKKDISPLGDSMVAASVDNLLKIHLHTNTPNSLMRKLRKYGTIEEQKADDMIMQAYQGEYACITDSAADLPQEWIFENNIFQMPINVLIDGVNYLDKLTIDKEFLYDNLDKASTSQLNTQSVKNYLEPILKRFKHVFIIIVSSKLSGTFNSVRLAVNELEEFKDKITLIDSKTISSSQGLIIKNLKQMIDNGKSIEKIKERLDQLVQKSKIVVSIFDIKPMAKSGRLKKFISNLLILLKIKPIISINEKGEGVVKSLAFRRAKNISLLLRKIKNKNIESYAIVHTGVMDLAYELKEKMEKIFNKKPSFITEVSTAITLFAGKGSVAISYIEK